MKVGTPTKLKFKRLAALLTLPEWQVVGILESLWQATYNNAPAGDIGRLSNQDIATAIGWTDDADALVDALVNARWLDRDSVHRLLIHDWPEHCASWLKANFARHGRQFAMPTSQVTQQPTSQAAEQPTQQVTEQASATVPPYHTKPSHTKPNQGDTTVSRSRTFKKPTVDEVAAYCKERGNSVDAEAFWHYHETRGWKLKGQQMTSWKSAVITWEKNEGKFSQNGTPATTRQSHRVVG